MAQQDADDFRRAEALSNAQLRAPDQPNLPTIAVPDNNPSNPIYDAPQTPSTTAQPRSRRGSFGFLRRSRSREIAPVTTGSDGNRKLSRRGKRMVSKEETTKNQIGMPPQLPSYHNLPQMNTPFVDGSPANNHAAPQPQAQYPNNGVHYPPSISNASGKPVSRSGYNKDAFYQKHLMAERTPTQSRNVTPQAAAGSSPPSTDSLNRAESMTNRGRYSYATNAAAVNGNVNSPRRVRRRKDPTPFNVLVVGTKSSGKTSFVEFLRSALTRPSRTRPTTASTLAEPPARPEQSSLFTSHYLETDLDGERIGVTVYDSNGLEKHLIDLQLREFAYFLESKFQETFNEEQKVMRATGLRDTHIHCVFLVLDPARLDTNIAALDPAKQKKAENINSPRVIGALDQDLDVDLLKTLQGKTTVIPVVSKADTVTTAHMAYLKRVVWDSFKKLNIDPLEVVNLDSDDEREESAIGKKATKAADDDEIAVETNYKPAPSASSVYDSAREDYDTESDANSDITVNRGDGKLKPTDNVDLTPTAAKTAPLKHEFKHDNLRYSAMSENVDLPMLPMSIISPDIHDPSVVGRRFPWGFADPYNAEHCDFTRMLESVFNEWRAELREASRERWYEGWRTNRLRTRSTVHQPYVNSRATSGQGRTVSGAVAYGGKGPESQIKPPSVTGASSMASQPASTNDIGVAVSSNGYTSDPPPPLPTTNGSTTAPKTLYRGVGSY